MTVTRGTTNRNDRGNTADRAARRAYLLATFGDGTTAPCYRCAVVLTDETITVDRITPGAEGGTYRRDNIRPACAPCNSLTGATLGVERKRGGKQLPAPVADPVILGLVERGKSNDEIAAILGVTTRTLTRWRGARPALNEAIMAARARRQRERQLPAHGTRRRRDAGCGCQPCRDAVSRHSAEMYQRRKARKAAGVKSQASSSQHSIIEAAIARGLTTSEVMAELGLPYHTVAAARATLDRAVAS